MCPMSQAAAKTMTLDEFLAWERAQPERYEFVGGAVRLMTGGSLDHSLIATNIAGELRQRLRGTACRVFNGDAKVLTAGRSYYPAVSVSWAPLGDGKADVVPTPVVVIEIVSPSTERAEKKPRYFEIPSLRHYAIVEQDEARIDLYTRTGTQWSNEVIEGMTATLRLPALDLQIGLADCYSGTSLDPRNLGTAQSAG
jgi:Uma2 family endonuclease